MPDTTKTYDVAVIGAGIAGSSVSAELVSVGARVVLVEQESQPGYHTTGRSAAVYSPIYGPQPIRALTRASLSFYERPPAGFTERPMLKPIDAAFIAREDQLPQLAAMQDDLADAQTLCRIEREELYKRLPLLRQGYAVAALWDNGTFEIDVAALHQGYLRLFKGLGGEVLTRAPVTGLECGQYGWTIRTPVGDLRAGTVVNAAGAWADVLGQMAEAERIGLVPKRRTALLVDAPADCNLKSLPLVIDVEEQFYLKPDAGKLLISPANEDPETPCDVRPDEMDIAICVDRIERAFDLSVRRIENSWAGLRSFVADRCPVAGFSNTVEGFYWLAGQGGYGIQSAPALAQYAAAEVTHGPIPEHILADRLDPQTIRPGRKAICA